MSEWKRIETAPEGIPVMTKIDDEKGVRNEAILVRKTRIPGVTNSLWWTENEDMYVYYVPTHWRPTT